MAIVKAGKSDAAGKAQKASALKKPRDHPPYAEMISEAIASLKERTGSSQMAIAKFIEERHKVLPPNFRKLLLVQLKKLVVSGKLTKVKKSFKLSVGPNKPNASKPAAAPKKKSVSAVSGKPKAAATKKKVDVKKPKVLTPAKKDGTKVTAVKKTQVKKAAPSKIKKAQVKKPKSIKSPVKKARK